MAEDLDEASNELIITDEDAVSYSVGDIFVMVENDEVGLDVGRWRGSTEMRKPPKIIISPSARGCTPTNHPFSFSVGGGVTSTVEPGVCTGVRTLFRNAVHDGDDSSPLAHPPAPPPKPPPPSCLLKT
jgi:hypothetical protein